MPERLIDSETLKSRIGELCMNNDDMFSAKAYERIIGVIEATPTIEAEPVRHGRWETIDSSFAHVYCSECGAAADKYLAKRYKGCPFCLCVMDATDTNVGGKGGADNG